MISDKLRRLAAQVLQIYCDLDGVLVDFRSGLPQFINGLLVQIYKDPDSFPSKLKKMARAAVQDQGGDLTAGNIPEMTFADFENNGKVRNFSYEAVKVFDLEFWKNLDWAPGGRGLWGYIKKYNPTILSSPIGESKGKIFWCNENLGLAEDRIILTHDKHRYADNGLLIDDMPKNTKPFQGAGGTVILHRSTPDTISQLKKLGF